MSGWQPGHLKGGGGDGGGGGLLVEVKVKVGKSEVGVRTKTNWARFPINDESCTYHVLCN